MPRVNIGAIGLPVPIARSHHAPDWELYISDAKKLIDRDAYDSICIDEESDEKVPIRAFIGVAPRLYMQVFMMPERKAADGQWIDWNKIRRRQSPRYGESADSYMNRELSSIVLQLVPSREVA